MGKKGRVVAFTALAVAVLAVIAWTLLRASVPDPVYQGKPLSEWLTHILPGTNTQSETAQNEAFSAVAQIGTNAIPRLLRMIGKADDFPLKIAVLRWASHYAGTGIHYTPIPIVRSRGFVGFLAIGARGASAIPELIELLNQRVSTDSEGMIVEILGNLGPQAQAAVPALLEVAATTNHYPRSAAIKALGQIHAESEQVVPVLTRALRDPDFIVQIYAVQALEKFAGEGKSAEPALVALLNDTHVWITALPKFDLHRAIESALQQIDPETHARVLTNAAPSSGR